MTWAQIQPFLVALAIGLLLGFERERSHRRKLPAGSRSFALLGLTGALAAGLGTWVVVAGFFAVGALIAFAYRRTSADDPGTTTGIAALVTYLLGVLTLSRPALAVALAVVVAALLISKTRIHRFAREVISEIELEDAIKFFAVAFVVLPLLPNRDLGPYGVLNPAKVWLLVVLLTGIGWVGYIGVRALGPRRGLLVTGMAGGFVSASATTASMARLSKTGSGLAAPLASALIASLATFVQLLVVVSLVDTDVLRRLWPPVAAGTVVLVAVAAFVYRRGPDRNDTADAEEQPTPARRPFALWPALLLAAVLTAALLLGRWGADVLGPQGAVLAAFATGLADAHAGAVAAASLAYQGQLTVDTALVAITASVGSNLVVKSVLAFAAGGRRFGLGFVAGMAAPAVAFGAALVAVLG